MITRIIDTGWAMNRAIAVAVVMIRRVIWRRMFRFDWLETNYTYMY